MKKHDVSLLDRMTDAAVLVVGDVVLDRFVYGRVERISPESPVPVLLAQRETTMLGGAGNTVANLAHLGVKTSLVCVIGQDDHGQSVKDMAQALNIDPAGCLICQGRPTTVKIRYLAGHQQVLRTDYEVSDAIDTATQDAVRAAVYAALDHVDVMVLSDYGKGVLTDALTADVIAAAQARGVTVLVDPKGADYTKYRGADIVTPNKAELRAASHNMSVSGDQAVIAAANHVIAQAGVKGVLATRSEEGMTLIRATHDPLHIRSASDVEVFDVSGAGDTVIATLAAAVAADIPLEEAVTLANMAGSIVVSKVGTAPIRLHELREAYTALADRPRGARAIFDATPHGWQEAAEEVRRWKARGMTVGFTNGCFDILHLGHVKYLADARAKCDRLIVGLNTDRSINILKGESRPVHLAESRAAVLAAIAAVDMVISFGATEEGGDNTACALIETLQPDIYFKGGDYTVHDIPEAPSVKRYGGVVDVMPVYEGHSTTNAIRKILS